MPSSIASGSTARSPSSPAPPPASARRSPSAWPRPAPTSPSAPAAPTACKATADQVDALGRRCLAVTADVAIPEDCTRVIEETVSAARRRRRARQQRRHRHRGPGHARDAGAVPPGDRRQPQRLLLDGAGVRAGDEAGLEHRQHRLGPRPDDGGAPAGRVRVEQGRDHRPHARPRAAVDRPQGHPRQRARARASSRPR